MPEPLSWRDLLKEIISDPERRERLAAEIGVNALTLTRWSIGETVPRSSNIRSLLHALPSPQQDQFRKLYEDAFGPFPLPSNEEAAPEIEYKFLLEVLETRATTSEIHRFWAISHLVLQHALRHLDPERLGMAIWVVRCMPPSSGNSIRSLRESVGQGTPPWESDLEQEAMFLGAESLAGYVVATCRPATRQNLATDTSFIPAHRTEHEASATATPLLYTNRVAGCLLIASTQTNFFLSPARLSLVHGYGHLIALAFEPEEFYPPEHIGLSVMPSLEVQRASLATFRQRLQTILKESYRTAHPLTIVQAERIVWQQLEEELINVPAIRESHRK
jgi:GAF domain-containing protein